VPYLSNGLFAFAFDGRVDLLKELLAHPGVDVNIRDQEYSQTALHGAVLGNAAPLECGAALLAAGADPCVLDSFFETPLNKVILEARYRNPRGAKVPELYRLAALLVASGDHQWYILPTPCLSLEMALVPVWREAPKELHKRLQPAVQARLREALRALHHGGMDEALKMTVMEKVFEA
jgi:hypothetical protein